MSPDTETARRRAAGFTLLEALVGLTLLGVALVSAAPMFIYAIHSNAVGADFGQAAALAAERLELLRGEPYLSLVPGGNLDTNSAGYFDDSDPDQIVRWRIVSNAVPVRSYVVTVRVTPRRITRTPTRPVTLTLLRGRGV